MKKTMVLILALAVFAFTQNYERCNIPDIPDSLFISTIPDGSCSRENVFVCNVGFNVAGEKSMLYLNISLNAACTSLETSRLAVYENPSDTTTRPSYTTFLMNPLTTAQNMMDYIRGVRRWTAPETFL